MIGDRELGGAEKHSERVGRRVLTLLGDVSLSERVPRATIAKVLADFPLIFRGFDPDSSFLFGPASLVPVFPAV